MADQAGWNTIESDAGVFTYLLEKLGVQDVQFEELIALDEDMLKQLGPIHGLIFLFKFPTDAPYTSASTPHDGSYDHNAASRLFFARQVIQNACATQALLALVLNKSPLVHSSQPQSSTLEIGPSLSDFLTFTMDFDPSLRGEALSNSEQIREAHNSFARSSPFSSETPRDPNAETEDAFHFIAYTSLDGQLFELDGLQPAPISHGACAPEEFAAKIIPVLQRRIERYPATEIRFNLLAMTRDRREVCKEIGDTEGLEREEAKRRDWAWENELRRCNFVGLIGETLKAVAAQKISEGSYDTWIQESKERTKKRQEARTMGAGDSMDVD